MHNRQLGVIIANFRNLKPRLSQLWFPISGTLALGFSFAACRQICGEDKLTTYYEYGMEEASLSTLRFGGPRGLRAVPLRAIGTVHVYTSPGFRALVLGHSPYPACHLMYETYKNYLQINDHNRLNQSISSLNSKTFKVLML